MLADVSLRMFSVAWQHRQLLRSLGLSHWLLWLIIGEALMILQAAREIKERLCNPSPDNLGRTSEPNKVADQIPPPILWEVGSGLNRPQIHVFWGQV